MNLMHDAATLDRRSSERHKSVLAVGKMVKDGRERFCLIRDIADGGLMIETSDALALGEAVMVETLGLSAASARVVWREGKMAGLAFDTRQDVDAMCRRGTDDNGFTIRGPRFASGHSARLRLGHRDLPVTIADISVGGARLIGVSEVQPDTPGYMILGPDAQSVHGFVRWNRDDEIGFRFAPALDRRTLIALID